MIKTKLLKSLGLAVSLMVGVGFTLTAEAVILNNSLGNSVVARQIWNVTCPNNTDRANFRIANLRLAQGNVIAALGKGGITSVQTDRVTTETGVPPWSRVKQGSGIYTLVIFKDVEKKLVDIESFQAEITCDREGIPNSSVNPRVNLQGAIIYDP